MFRQRKTRSIGVKEIAGRQFKIYTIVADERQVQPEIIELAVAHAGNNIIWPETDSGFGFVTVHFGDSIWLLVDLWKDDILCHYLFRSEYSEPAHFLPGPDDGTTACVWELEVVTHERDAWVRHVMTTESDYQQYLQDCVAIK